MRKLLLFIHICLVKQQSLSIIVVSAIKVSWEVFVDFFSVFVILLEMLPLRFLFKQGTCHHTQGMANKKKKKIFLQTATTNWDEISLN